jgi:hypothetical protein
MDDFRLPPETAALVDWQAVQDGFSLYPGFTAEEETEIAGEGKQPARHDEIDKAFKKARGGLDKAVRDGKAYKQQWLYLGFLAAVISVAATVVSAVLRNDWSWAGVGGVLLGQGGVIGCCFKFLNYFRGEDAIARLLAGAEAAFRLARNDEQHNMVMKWFIEQVTRFQ